MEIKTEGRGKGETKRRKGKRRRSKRWGYCFKVRRERETGEKGK